MYYLLMNKKLTSLDKNNIDVEFQTDRNVYVDLRQTHLARKVKVVKGRGVDTYKATKNGAQRRHGSTGTGDDDVEFTEEGEGVPHVTHVNNFLHSIFKCGIVL